MAGRKPTGVYTTIKPIPAEIPVTTGVAPLIYMRLTKGETLNRVTAQNWKEVVGYDLSFNPLYANLSRLMELTDLAYVVRLEKDTFIDNCIIAQDGTLTHKSNIKNFGDLVLDPQDLNQAINFTNSQKTLTITLTKAPSLGTIVFTNVSTTQEVGRVNLSTGAITGGVLTGTVVGTSLNVTLALTDPTSTQLNYSISYISKDSIATVTIGAKYRGVYLRGNFTLTTNAETNNYSISYMNTDTGIKSSYTGDFGVDLVTDNFTILVADNSVSSPTNFLLGGGSNGIPPTELPNPSLYSTINGTAIDWTFTLSAGLTGDLLRQVLIASEKLKKVCLYGSPHFSVASEFLTWKNSITAGYDWSSAFWSTEIYLANNIEYFIDGSISRYNAYANMYRYTGEVSNVPAGKLYGTLSGYSYTPTDHLDYAQDLVNARASYVFSRPNPTAWDQWTDSSQSDLHPLSYLNSAVTVLLASIQLKIILEDSLYLLETLGGGGNIEALIIANCTAYLTSRVDKGFLIDFQITVEKLASRSRTVTVQLTCAEDLEIIELIIEV